MRSSLVKLEPETLEIPAAVGDRPAEAVLNVTNVSASVLPGLFFCLYNQEKFDIVPENFSLQRISELIRSFRKQDRDDPAALA